MPAPLSKGLTAAVASRPEDVPLRLHLAGLLLDAGRQSEAISHAAQALQYAPDSAAARELMARAIGAAPAPAQAPADLDWQALEEQLSDVIPPRFTPGEPDRAVDVETSTVR